VIKKTQMINKLYFEFSRKDTKKKHAKPAKINKYSFANFARNKTFARIKQKIMTENEISYKIIGVAIELHKNLGAGLLESAYEAALAYDLRQIGLDVKQQVPMPFVYKEIKQDIGYRIDLIVENKVIIELKSVENLAAVHYAQTLTYLKLSDLKLGLLINFNTKILKEGIHRIVNNL
jgi:GxxExxY protein